MPMPVDEILEQLTKNWQERQELFTKGKSPTLESEGKMFCLFPNPLFSRRE
jgi:hypothetical protein